MAKRTNTLVGVEIEPSAVHAVAVSVNGTLAIRTAGMQPLAEGVVRDGEVVDVAALAEALRTLFRENSDLDKRVRIGIANAKVVVRVIELPPIADRGELEVAVRFQAQDEIPMPLDSAVLDFHPLDVVETPNGPRQRVVIVAARRDMVDKVLAAAREAGLRPEGIDLAAFGMVRALHGAAGPDETTLYLSIGGLTNLAVARGTICTFTRVVGDGLDALAVELAERRALTHDQARAWLAQVGLEAPVESFPAHADTPELLQDARAVLADGVRRIATEVRNTVDFHHAQDDGGANTAVARCLLTGAAAGVPGFAAALSAELGLPVEVGIVHGAPAGMDATRLSVGAGLALEEALA